MNIVNNPNQEEYDKFQLQSIRDKKIKKLRINKSNISNDYKDKDDSIPLEKPKLVINCNGISQSISPITCDDNVSCKIAINNNNQKGKLIGLDELKCDINPAVQINKMDTKQQNVRFTVSMCPKPSPKMKRSLVFIFIYQSK